MGSFFKTTFKLIVFFGLIFPSNAFSQSAEKPADIFNDILKGVLDIRKSGNDKQPARANRQRLPDNRNQIQLSFAPLVRSTSAAVVNVHAERVVRNRSPFAGDPFFEHFFGKGRGNQKEKQSSLGSGVIVDRSGIIVTNNHVIQGASKIRVALSNGREYASRVILRDERVDLAILKIEGPRDFATIELGDSDRPEVGDLVLAIGNPFGVGQTVTSGIVSALARSRVGVSDFGFFIQTDAAINPGNSGGALVNMQGELIGINTAIFSRSGGSNGIGFAIPSNMVRAIIRSATNGDETFERPFIGASFEPVSSDIAESLGLRRARGALVVDVQRGGSAARAGLRRGDVILRFDGHLIEHPDALGYRLATAGINKRVKMRVMSRGQKRTLFISLEKLEELHSDQYVVDQETPFNGVSVMMLYPQLARKLRLADNAKGLVITSVRSQSTAHHLGMKVGDIVEKLNRKRIRNLSDFQKIMNSGGNRWDITVNRRGNRIRQVFR